MLFFVELSDDVYGRSLDEADYAVSPATGNFDIIKTSTQFKNAQFHNELESPKSSD